MRYETVLLADRPDAIPVLARWYFDEWGRHDGKTQDGIGAELRRNADQRDTLPLFVVAEQGRTIAGAAALVVHDMDILTELSPWVSSVYVDVAHRRAGVGRLLLHRLETEARRLGFNRLYLYTRSQANLAFYGGLGWMPIHEVDYRDKSFVVMDRALD